MFHIILFSKPHSCTDCPLKNSLTRDCGQSVQNNKDSEGVNYTKVPDKRCKIKLYIIKTKGDKNG